MAQVRYFDVRISSGTSHSTYIIYYDQIGASNIGQEYQLIYQQRG